MRRAALILLTACITETGNPELDLIMVSTARTSAPTEVGLDPESTAAVTVDEAWVNMGDVRFVVADACDTPDELEVDGPSPIVGDLVVGTPEARVSLDSDRYCRIRLRMRRVETLPAGAPAELVDHTLRIAGHLADGTPFVVLSREQVEVDLRSRSEPFTLDEARSALNLSLDVAAWFDGVDLAGGELVDGVLRIDDDHAQDVLQGLEDRIEASLELYEDLDRDGTVDDSEQLLAGGA